MTSIPVAIYWFSGNKFKGYYPKKERPFVYFLLHFWYVPEIGDILKKKKSIPA